MPPAGHVPSTLMEQSSSPLEPGTRVRASFGRFQDQTGTVVEAATGLPDVFDGPVLWVRFDGDEEPGLVAGRFLERAA
ncbi:hypothetical protein SAMN04487904_104284 [Actinopolyspora lacussalsi subsp. righensis]|uniref:DUF1918 domain-containing protein n=4 Tax=Actinopolysporaceae TaxID=622451 RepID=A0A1G8WZA8_ACTMZ|nr:hypothetical protein SAMN04487820_102299 [Actinopolyspora mzabensis]SFD95051.1 hypothetical protein SAMN04487819_105308 [Actinopolyspora alba]SFT61254.1 hypothetical protein SAMN04487904_104284 [Actinopolyspora righensis]